MLKYVVCLWAHTFTTRTCSSDMLKGTDIVMTLWQMPAILKCINSDMDIIYRVHIDPLLLMHFTDPYSIPSPFRMWENTPVKLEQQSNISSSFSQI